MTVLEDDPDEGGGGVEGEEEWRVDFKEFELPSPPPRSKDAPPKSESFEDNVCGWSLDGLESESFEDGSSKSSDALVSERILMFAIK